MNRRDVLRSIPMGLFAAMGFGNVAANISNKTIDDQINFRPGVVGVENWDEEISRCRDGWEMPDGRFMSGYQYLYVNYATVEFWDDELRDTDYARPLFREHDFDFFNRMWENRNRSLTGKRNHIEHGVRGGEYENMIISGMITHDMIFGDLGRVGICSVNEVCMRADRDRLIRTLSALPSEFGKIVTKNGSVRLDRGGNSYSDACFGNFWSDNRLFRGHRMDNMYGFLKTDVLFTFKSINQFISENEPCIRLGDQQWGSILLVEINESYASQDLFDNSEKWNATRHKSTDRGIGLSS